MTEITKSPYFNMVQVENRSGSILVNTEKTYSRRQNSPKAFDMSTVAYAPNTNLLININLYLK